MGWTIALAVLLLPSGDFRVAASGLDENVDAEKKQGPLAAKELIALRQAQMTAARKAFEQTLEQYRKGFGDEEDVYRWSIRVLDIERRSANDRANHVEAVQGHLTRMKNLEKLAETRPIAVEPPPGPRTNVRIKKLMLLVDKDGKVVNSDYRSIRASAHSGQSG